MEGIRRFRALRVSAVALACAAGLAARGQSAHVTIPEGPRHFIVLVDSSNSMAAGWPKKIALAQAERKLTDLLFTPGRVHAHGPWFRYGVDIVTIVDYGIDTQGRADLAYQRLRYASLTTDYARVVTKANSRIRRGKFIKLLRPPFRTHLNILAWALPICLPAAAVASRHIQETEVVLIDDAQMNDGSVMLEDRTLGLHLNPSVRHTLRARQRAVRQFVRLGNAAGEPAPERQYAFGPEDDQVYLTVFRASPTTTSQSAASLLGLRPIEGAELSWTGARSLELRFAAPSAILDRKFAATLQAGSQRAGGSGTVARETTLGLRGIAPMTGARSADVELRVRGSAANPILGIQEYDVAYPAAILLPESPDASAARQWRMGVAVLALAGAVSAGLWAYHQRFVARHFQLWLPGFATPFSLPALSQNPTCRHQTRLPRRRTESAAYLQLPHRLVRNLFYRNASLHWDPELSVAGLPDGATSFPLTGLPRIVHFIWENRPESEGFIEIEIERSGSVKADRLTIIAGYPALPRPTTMSIPSLL